MMLNGSAMGRYTTNIDRSETKSGQDCNGTKWQSARGLKMSGIGGVNMGGEDERI